MYGVSTDKAPSVYTVVPHFIAAALIFVAISVLLILASDSFLGHFYQPKILAITHFVVLGWITMVIFGALYQLIPVVFETSLYSETVARIILPVYLIGVIGLVISFWNSSFNDMFIIASILTFLSLVFFSINILASTWTAMHKTYSAKFIVTALFWLLFTSILGLLLALNHPYDILDMHEFQFLKIHAHFGMIGWFLQLIIGVASVLIPMFLVSHDLDEKKLKYSYYSINVGLIGLSIDWFLLLEGQLLPIFAVLIVLGIGFFMAYLWDAYQHKLRKLDVGMKLSALAFASISLPIVLGIVLSMAYFGNGPIPSRITILYGFAIVFAFITPLILGQTYKTLPFIIWLHHYQKLVGKKKTPLPAELYVEKIATAHMWTFVIGISLFSFGILTSSMIMTKTGAVFFLITALLYLINVMKITFHKVKYEEIIRPKVDDSGDLKELLKTVIDPEVEINIVDMGLVYKLDIDNDKNVDIQMTLSTPACPLADSIVMNVMETIMTKHPDYEVNVHLVFEPKWSPKRISEEGRKKLKEGHKWKE